MVSVYEKDKIISGIGQVARIDHWTETCDACGLSHRKDDRGARIWHFFACKTMRKVTSITKVAALFSRAQRARCKK